jgi:uncharacterized protein YbbK (DUF523 family)
VGYQRDERGNRSKAPRGRHPTVYDGDGFDVLAGRGLVRSDEGQDWTEGMVRASHRMLELAQRNDVNLAMLMDTSAAWHAAGLRRTALLQGYRVGVGVAAATPIRGGIPVISQRDFRTLGTVFAHLDRPDLAPPNALDHHESDWYRRHFGPA